ncbi:MAG: ribosome-recycling factor [Patescibacteria group bacterium]
MDEIVSDFSNLVEKSIQALQEDLKSVRTGRATSALIEDLLVQTYGGQSNLKLLELATITTEGPSALVIVPFDVSTLQDIEKAILKSTLSLSPQTQTNRIIVKIPPLSQEQREKMTKLIGEKVEEKREVVRNHRDEARKKVRLGVDQKTITEDEKFRLEKEIDTQSQNTMNKIQELKDAKEKDILQL